MKKTGRQTDRGRDRQRQTELRRERMKKTGRQTDRGRDRQGERAQAPSGP